MSKVAFIFPGQGSQYVGMGEDFYNTYPCAKEVFDTASKVSGVDLKHLCFEENEDIHITEYTQIAMLTTSIAMLKVLEEKGYQPTVTAGLSLGEYCALVAANRLTLEDAAKVVRQRGLFMQEAVPNGVGAMAAILGLDRASIQVVLNQLSGVQIANDNCPGQIVISGYKESVEKACELLKEAGARRAMLLNVSGPFHSELLKTAGEQLEQVLENITILDSKIPYYANVNAKSITDSNEVKTLLVKQVSSSVLWNQTMRQMIEDGITTFVEIGPGKTLSGFLKKCNKELKAEITIYSVEKIEDLENLEL